MLPIPMQHARPAGQCRRSQQGNAGNPSWAMQQLQLAVSYSISDQCIKLVAVHISLWDTGHALHASRAASVSNCGYRHIQGHVLHIHAPHVLGCIMDPWTHASR